MNISLNWLKRYIDIDMPVEGICEILTDIGLEVEGVKTFETVKGGLEGLVVGLVVECGKHPNADKLSLTKVDVGDTAPLQIVCGAPNVAEGQKVVVATIGTTLYTPEGESWKIKKGKIRGEESQGMICAEDEIGLGTDHSGIIVLPDNVSIGTLAKDYYQVETDNVIEIGLTPNRSDATNHLGVAKDLAAYLRINNGWTGNVKTPEISSFKVDVDEKTVPVVLENEEACPRYSGVTLTNIEIGPSPKWMQDALSAVGVRPINNVVDITNYVLHEYGQPLHAFDLSKIGNQEIRVKNLPSGTPFLSLDDKERKLLDSDLMICDGAHKPMCIGGVFGGLDSGVTDATTEIFLEAAHFSASSIRKTSTKHLLRTDAAKVFEKGSDPNLTVTALKRAALLLKEYAGAQISSDLVDVYPTPILPKEIHVQYKNINRLIGTTLDKEEVHNILRALEMELSPIDNEGIMVKVPTNKADVIREVDVIEEVLRIYGFNKVPIPEQLKTAISFRSYPTKNNIKERIANLLTAQGFNEMMGLSLIESRLYDNDNGHVQINNTSNIHLDIMRPEAMTSGLLSVAHNINHQQYNLRLYEFGRTYQSAEEEHIETDFLSLMISGSQNKESWRVSSAAGVDFYNIKGWVALLLNALQIDKYQVSELEDEKFAFGYRYHRGDKDVVRFGKVSHSLADKVGVSKDVYAAIFDLKTLYRSAQKISISTTSINKYPASERDLAIVIDETVKYEDVLKVIRKTEKKLITDVQLFDIYRNAEQLGPDKKSYAIRMVFQDQNKTLNDKQLDKIMNNLINNLQSAIGANIRK